MCKGTLDEPLQSPVLGAPGAPSLERDQGGVHVRRRTEDGPRDRMRARPDRRQPNEHRDAAVAPGPRLGEESVGDLALHHHAPALHQRQPVQGLDHDGRRHLVREIRNELCGRRLESREREYERVPENEIYVLVPGDRVPEVRLETPVELDRVNVGDPLRPVARQNAKTGSDLQNDVPGGERREAAGDSEDVVVGEEVLAKVAVRRHRVAAHGSSKASAAFDSICRPSSSTSSPRASASIVYVWTTLAGSFGRPRTGWGAR